MPDEPSAPGARDDDEFAAIPAPSRGKNPLVAAIVIVLAAVLGWHLRADVRYAFGGRQPGDLGDARSFKSRGVALEDNRFVSVTGQAERRYALWVEPKGERSRETIFRLLGAGTRLFVRAGDSTGRADLAERWSGRLRRFDAVPYAESLRKYYAATEVVRYLALDELKTSLEGGAAGELHDRMGEPVAVAPSQPLVLDIDYPGQLKVYLSKDKFPSLADAHHELARMQLSPSPGEETKDEFVFVIAMSDARKNEIVEKLSAKEFTFQPREERYRINRSELALAGGELTIGTRAKAPWDNVKAVGVPAPLTIGHDAFILVEGETPSQYWWAPLLVALLIAFAAFNLWYLVRALRSPRTE
jgi:hypothetical protein